jgi:nucleotide-binding universal stress UspA family protein
MTKTMERVAADVVVHPDTYKTLLVHAEPGLASSHRVEAAMRLARDLDARLIGLGAEALEPMPASDPFFGYGAGEWVAAMQEQVGKDLAAAETAFRRDATGVDIEWRVVQDYPHLALTRLARAADLVVVGPRSQVSSTRSADPADVVMSAGRPVLVVPEGRHHLHALPAAGRGRDRAHGQQARACRPGRVRDRRRGRQP